MMRFSTLNSIVICIISPNKKEFSLDEFLSRFNKGEYANLFLLLRDLIK